MRYYDVLVASLSYHGAEPLTYSWHDVLKTGTVVNVHLKNESINGIVVSEKKKPPFTVKPINKILEAALVPVESLELHRWIQEYYPSPMGSITQLFTPPGPLKNSSTNGDDMLSSIRRPTTPPPLTTDQSKALTDIGMDFRPALIHGDTGTGKTRIYLELVLRTLSSGKNALVLTPEISLTPQLVETFLHHIHAPIRLVHSGLSIKERRKTWLDVALATTPQVLIGPRSALFYPLHNIGIIILDECHDGAYKQEQTPRYHASRVAAKLAELYSAKLVMGSATPSVDDYYLFGQKKLEIARLIKPAITNSYETFCTVIDMKDRTHFSRSSWLSDTLLSAIDSALGQERQSLVFLNRRGSSRLVLCQHCGWEALCRRCDLPLTYHHDKHVLICHTCGHSQTTPSKCPECSSTEILFKSIGTKTLESDLQRIYPNARVARFDSDLPSADKMERQYDAVKKGNVDIIVGTQMISKGLDLPRLGVVGIALADTSLYFPDYTATESTFQLISQVAGRVGRGHGASTVVVQSYSPESPAVTTAIARDYEGFYRQEIQERQSYYFPPFCFILKLRCSKKTALAAEKQAESLAKRLRETTYGVSVEGPCPSFLEKVSGLYRWQIIIKSPSRKALVAIIGNLPSGWTYDLDPLNLL